MINRKIAAVAAAVALGLAGAAYAELTPDRVPVEFFSGHSHTHDGGTVGAPQHSGGTNSAGCHNGSVPYHCH